MTGVRYALVSYIQGPIASFVENLRRELHPDLPHLAAHLTLLPPRPLCGPESEALKLLAEVCGLAEPFEVTLGAMESFVPGTPTIYIGVTRGASRMEDLHRQLNRRTFVFCEEWPYVPHLTIAKMNTESAAAESLETARRRWLEYSATRQILLSQLTFVREDAPNRWIDLAPVRLGGRLVPR